MSIDTATAIDELRVAAKPETRADIAELTEPGMTEVVVCGEWVERYQGDWRDDIDLATADRPTVYAAGARDGYVQAWREIGALQRALVEWLDVWGIECLEQCICGRKLRHIKAGADELYPACDKGWSL